MSETGGNLAASPVSHTPYDGSHPPFRIGLHPLDLNDWIEADKHLDFYLDEKERIAKLYPGKTFMAEPETDAVQHEVLQLISTHVEERFPQIYRRDGNIMRVNGRQVHLDGPAAKLQIAAQLVQEDLLIMRRDGTGWRLAAGSLCFPSSWSLGKKFSRRMEDIHAPVPGFGPATRNAAMINRIFDKLQLEQPVWRMNWSIYSDDQLFHDDRRAEHMERQEIDAGVFLRVEYQTLRKLPESGDLLFTVRIHIDPLSLLSEHPDRRQICARFSGLLEALNVDQLSYKGLLEHRDTLLAKLDEIAGAKAPAEVEP